MKKYTQPTVEITAFDFEDIICDSSSMSAENYAANKDSFNSAVTNTVVVDAISVQW